MSLSIGRDDWRRLHGSRWATYPVQRPRGERGHDGPALAALSRALPHPPPAGLAPAPAHRAAHGGVLCRRGRPHDAALLPVR